MRNFVLFFLMIVALTTTVVAQGYNPVIAKAIDVTVPANPTSQTGAIVLAIGTATPQVPICPGGGGPGPVLCGYWGLGMLVSVVPAFPPVVIGCAGLGGASQVAQNLATGITANSAAVAAGYSASASGNRILIHGPGAPNSVFGYDYEVIIFHAEIHQQYGLVLEPALPVRNLCDGTLGNEAYFNASTGTGIEFAMVTIPDPLVGDFDVTSGTVVPPHWTWDGSGRVSVEPNGFLNGPTSGFPVSGGDFPRLSTPGGGTYSGAEVGTPLSAAIGVDEVDLLDLTS